MNKAKILTILLVICLLALGGGSWMIFGRSVGVQYANAEMYSVGPATLEDAVENLDIHWIDGSVNIEYHAENTVVLSETSKKDIPEDLKLRWWLDGTTLRIQYGKSGIWRTKNLQKALTLTLPEGFSLDAAEIHSTSADVIVPSMDANSLLVESTSGDMNVAASAVTISVVSTSGDIRVRQSGSADSVALSATSGEIVAELEDVATLTTASNSGNIDLTQTGKSDALRLESTSGEIHATLNDIGQCSVKSTSGDIRVAAQAFGEVEIGATSGDVTVALPAEPGFTADVRMTSGSFDSDIALAKDGKVYTCGDGSGKLSVHTTSGDVRLTEAM